MEMASAYESLAAEIDRVVTSPYPTQLKSLRDLLQGDSAVSSIAKWALAKPCQIERLASCVLEGLRQWPYVLDIVEKLCCNVTIRDAFLAQEPRLLHDIILQALRGDDVHSRYAAVAVSMLVHPLPHRISMPADTQALFIRVFNHAAELPSVTTIKPAYQLLQGSAANLLMILSSKTLVRIEDQIFEILRTMKADTSPLSLYCLAILRVMLATAEDDFRSSVSSYDTQELLASTQLTSSRWSPDAARQFFHGSKAQKTVQLVVLRAMWACTSASDQQLDERLESLKLANGIIDSVPIEGRMTWRKANALVVRKLEEKATAPELEPASRYQALCFLLRLTKGTFSPALIIDHIRELIVKPTLVREVMCFGELPHLQLLISSGVFDQATTRTLLQNAVDFSASATHGDIVELRKPLERLLALFATAITHEESIAEGIMLALDGLSCGDRLHQMARQLESIRDHTDSSTSAPICDRAVQIGRSSLVHGLCNVFLLALLSPHQASYPLPPEMRPLLLGLHASSARQIRPCSHARQPDTSATTHLSFVESASTPGDLNLDWRHALAAHLETRTRTEHQSISAIFCQATSDLEARCESVERPLLEERALRQQLQKQYDELNGAYVALETESMDRNIRLDVADLEKEQCIRDLESANAEVDDLMRRLHEAESGLQDSKNDLDRKLKEASEAGNALELRHSAAFAKKEEAVEELQEQLRAAAVEARARVDEIANLKHDVGTAKTGLDEATSTKDRLEVLSNERQLAIEKLQSDMNEANKLRTHLEGQLSGMQEQLRQHDVAHAIELAGREGRLRVELQDKLDAKSHEIDDLNGHRDELHDNIAKAQAEIERLHRVDEQQTARLEKRDRKNADLQKEIDRLHRKCEQKDQQISEANAMRANLMAAMGLNGLQQLPQASLPFRSSRSFTTQNRQHEPDTQDDPIPPTPFSGDDAEAEQTNLQASFASTASSTESRSGPTPKRAKPRPSMPAKIKTPAKARSSVASARSTRSSLSRRSTMTRQPLASIDANPVERRSVGAKTPMKGLPEGMDASTFDGSELFGGTQGGEMLDLQGAALDG